MARHEKYDEQLEEARRFEDYASLKLYQKGIVICLHGSRNYQRKGESRAGFEIKYDKKWQETRNLFIEIEERHHEDSEFKPSGIYCDDNSWIYVIGDYHVLWLIQCKTLQLIENKYEKRETQTAKGFLLPVADADKYAGLVIRESEQPKPLDQLRQFWNKASDDDRLRFLSEIKTNE